MPFLGNIWFLACCIACHLVCATTCSGEKAVSECPEYNRDPGYQYEVPDHFLEEDEEVAELTHLYQRENRTVYSLDGALNKRCFEMSRLIVTFCKDDVLVPASGKKVLITLTMMVLRACGASRLHFFSVQARLHHINRTSSTADLIDAVYGLFPTDSMPAVAPNDYYQKVDHLEALFYRFLAIHEHNTANMEPIEDELPSWMSQLVPPNN